MGLTNSPTFALTADRYSAGDKREGGGGGGGRMRREEWWGEG